MEVLSVLLNGTFMDENSNKPTKLHPPQMEYANPTKMVSIQVSEYTINTFLEASASTGAPIDISSLLAVRRGHALSTVDLGLWIPKIVNKYGDQLVDLKFTILPDSACQLVDGLNTGSLKADVNVAMNISIMDETILSATFMKTRIEASLFSDDGALKGEAEVQLGQIGTAGYVNLMGLSAADF